eukprot:385476_1
MSLKTSESSIFKDPNAPSGYKKVWNRAKQCWVEIPLTQADIQAQEQTQKAEKVSSNAFACGSNQNCNVGLTGRSSTRVHAPPGGVSSFSLSHDEGPQPSTVVKQATQKPMQNQFSPPAGGGNIGSGGAIPSYSSNAFANGANQNSGNFISDRSSTKVHAPPGGASTISFG